MVFPIEARFTHPDAGWDSDQEQCARLLTIGEVYTVSQFNVGRSSSSLNLLHFPGEQFNSVMFDAAPAADEHEDTEPVPVTPAAITAAALVLSATGGTFDADDYAIAGDALRAALPHLAFAAGQAVGDHIASLQARIDELRALAAEILASYHQGSDGYRGRVGQVQIGRWQDRLGETP